MTVYHEIDGLVFTGIVKRDGIDISPAERKSSEHLYPGRDYPLSTDGGRGQKKFTVQVHSETRSDIQEFIAKVNKARRDAEFRPFLEAETFYIESAWADWEPNSRRLNAGLTDYRYRAKAEITCRSQWSYGPKQGVESSPGRLKLMYGDTTMVLGIDPALPLSTWDLVNEGNKPAGLDYLRISGGYSSGYTTGLLYRFAGEAADRDIALCDSLMVGDRFKLNSWGEVEHSYHTKFYETYAIQQRNMLGATYCNYGAGGSCAYEDFRMGAGGILAMPSYGPLPVSGVYPVIEFNATLVGGNIEVVRAFVYDLTDAEVIDCDTIQQGYNRIEVPGCTGEDLVVLGLRVPTGGSLRLSEFEVTVPRYMASSRLPKAIVGEEFSLSLRDGSSSNHVPESATIYYRDLFW